MARVKGKGEDFWEKVKKWDVGLVETWVEVKEWERIRKKLPVGYSWRIQEAKRERRRRGEQWEVLLWR